MSLTGRSAVAIAVIVVVAGGVVAWGLYLRAKIRAGEITSSFWSGVVDDAVGVIQGSAGAFA